MASVAMNYAEVLFQLPVSFDSIKESGEIIRENPVLVKTLNSPVISLKEKYNVIDKIFPDDIKSFIKVVCEKGRAGYISEIFTEYKRLYNKENSIIDAEILYVAKPTEEQQEKIKALLIKKLGVKTVNLNLIHSPNLMGGFVIKADGIEYDRSYKGKIDALNRKLVWR